MRAASALVLTTACAASAGPASLRNTDKASTGAAIDVAFAATTLAFATPSSKHAASFPLREDDRRCPTPGPAWRDAEEAVLAAFDAARLDDARFVQWRSAPLRVEHTTAERWIDADHVLALRREHGETATGVAIHITQTGGYLTLWGPPGDETFCFVATRQAGRTVLVPRVVAAVEY
jgi:hypothetical protein